MTPFRGTKKLRELVEAEREVLRDGCARKKPIPEFLADDDLEKHIVYKV